MRSFILRILQCSDFFLYSLVLVYVLFSGVGLWGFHLWCIFFVLLGWFMCCMWLYYAYYNAVTLYSLVVVYVFGFFLGGGWGFQSSFCMLSWIVYLVYAHLIYLVYEHRPLSS